jgi:hypothetical protein
MQTVTELIFRLSPPGGVFDETVIRNILADRSEAARKVLVHRAVAAGEIIRLSSCSLRSYEKLTSTHSSSRLSCTPLPM